MKRSALVGCLLAALSVQNASAFDFTAQELPTLMNGRSSAAGWPIRATMQKCASVEAVHGTICTYDVTANVAMSAVSYSGNKHVGSVAIAMHPGSNPDPFAKEAIVIATLCSPGITSDERSKLITDLFSTLSTEEEPSERTIIVGSTAYFVTRKSKLGFIIRADDKASD